MKILVVDDSAENLDAAKLAAKDCSEHEFQFTNSAKEAVALLCEADAIITDLFFPNQGHDDGGELDTLYALYRSKMRDNPLFPEVKSSYKDYWNSPKAREALNDARVVNEYGTLSREVEIILRLIEQRGGEHWRRDADRFRDLTRYHLSPRFPYGGALMLHAKFLGKGHCLISDINRHPIKFYKKDASEAVDGMMLLLPINIMELLLPLIGDGIISIEQARNDGNKSLTYIGSDEVNRIGKGKNDPALWAEAIRRTLAQ